jgi:hypothetical protein
MTTKVDPNKNEAAAMASPARVVRESKGREG